jgi:histone H3/H4
MSETTKREINNFRDKRVYGNINLTLNTERIIKEVIENMEVRFNFNKREKEIVIKAIETTLWQVFERSEEIAKEFIPEEDYENEFGKDKKEKELC